MLPIIRQLEEKNVANEIDLLVWSDRMDLVAFSNVKGEVALHRLSWTRAWSLGPPKDGDIVKAMSWRPDGKILAIGYSSGKILLINVENKKVLYTIDIIGTISFITWIQEKIENKTSTLLTDETNKTTYSRYIDYSPTFLPEPQNLANFGTSNTHEPSNFFQRQTDLNLLIIGTLEGFLYFSIFGCFPCATINLNEYLGIKCSVLSVHLSESLNCTVVTVKDANGDIKILFLNTTILETHKKELFSMAFKHQQIKSSLCYLSNTISTIKETWESILLEMDSKLSKYAEKTPSGTLSADFLDLLMFGISSDEMQEFLLHDLTKKGLEKFGQTIEMSYASIQKLLLKNVTKVGQNITYHLAELRGMARLEHRFKILGLSEDNITYGISSNGSFLIKSGEMQQIINNSMLNYKAFFRWLYTAIIHLMYESVPPEIPKMTQQDLGYITEFLQNFDDITGQNNTAIGGTEKTGFIMERLGQYLSDSPLTILPTMDLNEWDNFLIHNECIRSHPSVTKHYKEMSLIQQFTHLENSIDTIFKDPQSCISEEIKLSKIINCVNVSEANVRHSCINTDTGTVLFAFLSEVRSDGFYIVEFSMENIISAKAAFIYISKQSLNTSDVQEKYLLTDIKFYTENYISLLLQEDNLSKSGVLYQCPIVVLRDKFQPIILSIPCGNQDIIKLDCGDIGQNMMKNISMVASKFAVSGCRRVSIVLSENKKKVMLFEMEGEEEEDEDADMTNSTIRESDASMRENSDAE